MTYKKQFEKINLENTGIEIVSEYKYVGQTTSFENRTKNEPKIGRKNGWRAFRAQSKI